MKRRTIVLNAVGFIGLRGFVFGTVLGGIYGTLAFPIVGTMYGTLFGAIIGLPLGLIGGAALGLIIALFFNPVTNAGIFRLIMPLIGGAIGFTGAFLGFAVLLGGDGDLLERSVRMMSYDDFLFGFVPTVVAGVSAAFVSHRYARHYLNVSNTKQNNNH